MYRLFVKSTNLSMMAIALWLTYNSECLASEYVFTAPPEVRKKTHEIPQRETEYPLYECNTESETESATNSETALDSHDCSCAEEDCAEPQETHLEQESASKSNPSEQVNHK
jgi:hypothetical protein